MSEVYRGCFKAEIENLDSLYFIIKSMRTGDILDLENMGPDNKRISLFADSLLARGFKGKFLVSRREDGDKIYGITAGRTAA